MTHNAQAHLDVASDFPNYDRAERLFTISYNIRARISLHFVFSPDEDSCSNCRNVGKFL